MHPRDSVYIELVTNKEASVDPMKATGLLAMDEGATLNLFSISVKVKGSTTNPSFELLDIFMRSRAASDCIRPPVLLVLVIGVSYISL